MKLHLFVYSCHRCGNVFNAPEIASRYGAFLLRSETSGNLAFVEATSDRAFEELRGILDGIPRLSGQDSRTKGEIVQRLFGLTCDPDPDGSPYAIGRAPRCPRCRSSDVGFVQATDPPQFVDLALAHVSHSQWDALSMSRKVELVEQALPPQA